VRADLAPFPEDDNAHRAPGFGFKLFEADGGAEAGGVAADESTIQTSISSSSCGSESGSYNAVEGGCAGTWYAGGAPGRGGKVFGRRRASIAEQKKEWN
jgi:hypothetical protein